MKVKFGTLFGNTLPLKQMVAVILWSAPKKKLALCHFLHKTCTGFYLENFFLGGSFKYVWEGPTRSAKILQRMHGEM